MRIRLQIDLPTRAARAQFEKICMESGEVWDGDIWKDRVELDLKEHASLEHLLAVLAAAGFSVPQQDIVITTCVSIDGMTCHSCEITVEREFKKLPGVKRVHVDASKGVATIETYGACPDVRELHQAVQEEGYRVHTGTPQIKKVRPSLLELAGLFGAVILLGQLLSAFGFFSSAADGALASGAGFAAAALIGLVAGSSSCLAVSGGLMLSVAGKYREHFGDVRGVRRMYPVFAFLAGRIASYSIFGGVIGAIGYALTPSPLATGAITVLAAIVMIVLGLDILGIAPLWLKRLMPRMPKSIAHRLIDAEGREHPAMPTLLGAATFFIPCGFTQALQIYALTSGGFFRGAAILGGFAIGTVPALLALGFASSALKGKAGALFLKFSGATVVVLGLWNIQNGFTVAGYPLSLPRFASSTSTSTDESNVRMVNGTQTITMRLTGTPPYYAPSDHYTITAGVPVHLEIKGVGMGCRSMFQIPAIGVAVPLTQSVNTVDFTPQKPGELTFSCAMGMYRGSFTVKEKI